MNLLKPDGSGFTKFSSSLVAIVLFIASSSVFAVYPETGMYVDDRESNRGRGFYIEVQNDIVFLVIYAYNEETGEAEIYTAASEIRDDPVSTGLVIPGDPPPNPEGYFPLHWMLTKLYKIENGPCLTCDLPEASFTAEEVGDVAVFFPFKERIRIS